MSNTETQHSTARPFRPYASRPSAARHKTEPSDARSGLVDALGRESDTQPSTAGPAPMSEQPEITPRRDAVFRRLLALADIVAAVGALGITGAVFGHSLGPATVATMPLIVLIAKMTGRYDHDELVLRKSTLDELPALVMLAGSFALAWSLLSLLVGDRLRLHAGGVSVLWLSTAALLVVARASARGAAQLWAPHERVLIVGRAAVRATLARCLAADPGARVEVVGFLPLEDERCVSQNWGSRSRRRRNFCFGDLERLVREFDVHRVFLIPTTEETELVLNAVSRTTALGVKVSLVPRLFEVVGSTVEFDTVGGVTVLGVRRAGLTRSSLVIKRAVDLIGAGIALLAALPLVAVVALAIKLDSSGPVLFRQRRVGRDGRVFEMLKFRSMYDGAHTARDALAPLNETDGVFKLSADPRVTRVGRLLRRTSVDELPQLINVLRGEMSLVGPRPLVVDEDRLVEGRHRERLQFAPGMTGPWQVLGPRRPPLGEMVKTDYLYAANWSLWTDVKIMLRTISHVFAQRGL